MKPSHRLPFCWLVSVSAGLISALSFGQDVNVVESSKRLTVDYIKDVRPILRTKCSTCHNEAEAEGGLRLDVSAGVLKGGDSGPAIVPGNSQESLLIQAVRQTDDLKMPPPEEAKPLDESQVEILSRWIDQGAVVPENEFQVNHWAFQKPSRPPVPKIEQADSVGNDGTSSFVSKINPIDAFLNQRHQLSQLQPLPAAPKHVQLRRVYLDLLGIPPTPRQLQLFLEDHAPDAWEKVIEELLASPQYGERWGRHWMDVWRYSDWDGHAAEVRESKPHIWRWRDWIIESLNDDKPYDQMILEMLAGDEIAPLDPQTLRATGFLVRNWYLFNRNTWLDNTVEHTGKAFLGVTFNCARCHDHMYDPISQAEYYQLRAFFEPHEVRTDRLPGQSDVTKDGLARIYDAHAETQTLLFVRGDEKNPLADQPLSPRVPKALCSSELAIHSVELPAAAYYPGLQSYLAAEIHSAAETEANTSAQTLATAQLTVERAQSELIAWRQSNSVAKPVEPFLVEDFSGASPDIWAPGVGNWRYQNGHLEQLDPADTMCNWITRQSHPLNFSAKLKFRGTGGDVYKSVGIAFDFTDEQNFSYVYASAGGSKIQVAHRVQGADQYPPAGAKGMPIELNREHEILVAVQGSQLQVTFNGERVLSYTLPHARPGQGRFHIWTYDATAQFLALEISGDAVRNEADLLASVQTAESALRLAEMKHRVATAGLDKIRTCMAADLAGYSKPPAANFKELALVAAKAERTQALFQAELNLLIAEQSLSRAKSSLPLEGSTATETQLKAVSDAEAAVLAAKTAVDSAQQALAEPSENYSRLTTVYPSASTGRRLALARWIASRENPLTARVAINHIWLRHFHQPLVPTVFDFGMNGKQSLHPELLDWLACELMDQGWKMKSLHRLILTSEAYRRSSSPSAEHREIARRNATVDPDNGQLWRQNSYRMQAEVVRDATLHVAGKLDTTLYGPDIDPNAGQTLGRRSIYFRNSKEKKMAFLSAFDGPNPVECYQRPETVSPQQSLAMSNSPLTLAHSRIVAAELSESLANEPHDRATQEFVARAFSKVLNREPSELEATECIGFLKQQTDQFSSVAALTAFPAGGDTSVKPSADPAQRARENLIHVLFNHNDFVTVR